MKKWVRNLTKSKMMVTMMTQTQQSKIEEKHVTKEDDESIDDDEVTIERVDKKDKSRGDNELQPKPEDSVLLRPYHVLSKN